MILVPARMVGSLACTAGKRLHLNEEWNAMADEKKEKWLGYVAVTTILFAVCATLSTFKGGQYSTKAMLSQSKAANQWAYYQAKDLKGYMHELQRDSLQLAQSKDSAPNLAANAAYAEAVGKKIASYSEKIQKYEVQKDEIKKQAEEYERTISEAQAHSQAFGLAVIFLQIAILLCSLSALMKIIHLWYGGLAIGVVGVTFFVNGFLVFF